MTMKVLQTGNEKNDIIVTNMSYVDSQATQTIRQHEVAGNSSQKV